MIYTSDGWELDTEGRDLRRNGVPAHVEPQAFDLVVYLLRNRHRVVSKDELIEAIWNGRIVSESTLSSRINAARMAIGDADGARRLIKTFPRRGFRFVGEVREREEGAGSSVSPPATPGSAEARRPRQQIRYVRTSNGVHIACATAGGGPPLVKTANWLNHLEYDWESPVWSPLFTQLAAGNRLIRYDERGTGLSDRDVASFSFEAFVGDLEAVVDAHGLDRFALFGVSQGAPIAIAYAVRHPHRVSRLVLCGAFAQGWRKRGNPADIARAEASITLIREGWGQDNPASRQMFTSLILPDATLEEMRWLNELERRSASPETALMLLQVIGEIDVMDLLPRLSLPVLLLHSRGDARVPFEHGRTVARLLPNARFVPLESRNHLILSHEPAFQRLVSEINAFLGEDCAKVSAPLEFDPSRRATR